MAAFRNANLGQHPAFLSGPSRAMIRSMAVRRSRISATTEFMKAAPPRGGRASGMPSAAAIASLAVIRLEKVNSQNGSNAGPAPAWVPVRAPTSHPGPPGAPATRRRVRRRDRPLLAFPLRCCCDPDCASPTGSRRRRSQSCEPTAEERGAVNPHATFCGNLRRPNRPGDPIESQMAELLNHDRSPPGRPQDNCTLV